MGAVVAAHHTGLDEKVAIKFILPEHSQQPDIDVAKIEAALRG